MLWQLWDIVGLRSLLLRRYGCYGGARAPCFEFPRGVALCSAAHFRNASDTAMQPCPLPMLV